MMHLAFLIVATPLSMLLGGWVMTLLWLWFVVPFGLPPVGMAHAIGLRILAAWLTAHLDMRIEDKRSDTEKTVGVVVVGFVVPLIVLLVCYIVKGAM